MNTPSFVIELPIRTDDHERRTIVGKLEYARCLHNATLGTALGQLQQMRQDPAWKKACRMPKGKERTNAFRALDRQYGLTEYDLHAVIARHRQGSGRKEELGINETQKIATRIFQAVSRYKLGLGGRPRFKSQSRGLHSIEGKTNKTGLKFKPETSTLDWCGHEYRVLIDQRDGYLQRALREEADPKRWRKVKYCRLVRRRIRGKERFYLQVVLEGTAPLKRVYAPVVERLAIDPCPQTVAVFCPRFAGKIEVAPHAKVDEAELRVLQRSMDRSLRSCNPKAYNEDGTIKPGVELVKSKGYLKRVARLQELYRKAAATRKCDHGQLINLLLCLAGEIRIEKNSWAAFQRSHFGKSLGRSGVADCLSQLKAKAESAGLKVIEAAPYKLKLSQYDPYTDSFRKKQLNERWHRAGMGDEYIQRDVLSAALLYCADLETQSHIPKAALALLEGAKQLLKDAGYWVSKPTSSQDPRDPRFAPEPKALTPETVRLEIFGGTGDSPLQPSCPNGSKGVEGKVSACSKETFLLQQGVV